MVDFRSGLGLCSPVESLFWTLLVLVLVLVSAVVGTVQVCSLHRVLDPVQEVPQSGVDPVFALGGTFLPPADDPGQKPGPSVVDYKRPPTVAAAGVYTDLQVTCTEHVVCDHLRTETPVRNKKTHMIT